MNFTLIDFKITDNYDFSNYTTKVIENYEDFLEMNFILDDFTINNDFFTKNSLINVLFFDGSLPKRFIKDCKYIKSEKKLEVITNKEDITFSTMDYRAHHFLIAIDKLDITDVEIK